MRGRERGRGRGGAGDAPGDAAGAVSAVARPWWVTPPPGTVESEAVAALVPLATSLAQGAVAAGKRRRDDEAVPPRLRICHAFAATGKCRFGGECKYAHTRGDDATVGAAAASDTSLAAGMAYARAAADGRAALRADAEARSAGPAAAKDGHGEPAAKRPRRGDDSGGIDDGDGDAAAILATPAGDEAATPAHAASGEGAAAGDDGGEGDVSEEAVIPAVTTAVMRRYVERYFTRMYSLGQGEWRGADMFVYMHTNSLCVWGLAPSHPLAHLPVAMAASGGEVAAFGAPAGGGSAALSVVAVTYRSQFAPSALAVVGKRKRGGVTVREGFPIANVHLSDGTVVPIPCPIRGSIIETNARLAADPSLLTTRPDTDGYLAIVMVPADRVLATRNSLLTHEAYTAVQAERTRAAAAASATTAGGGCRAGGTAASPSGSR